MAKQRSYRRFSEYLLVARAQEHLVVLPTTFCGSRTKLEDLRAKRCL